MYRAFFIVSEGTLFWCKSKTGKLSISDIEFLKDFSKGKYARIDNEDILVKQLECMWNDDYFEMLEINIKGEL